MVQAAVWSRNRVVALDPVALADHAVLRNRMVALETVTLADCAVVRLQMVALDPAVLADHLAPIAAQHPLARPDGS